MRVQLLALFLFPVGFFVSHFDFQLISLIAELLAPFPLAFVFGFFGAFWKCLRGEVLK